MRMIPTGETGWRDEGGVLVGCSCCTIGGFLTVPVRAGEETALGLDVEVVDRGEDGGGGRNSPSVGTGDTLGPLSFTFPTAPTAPAAPITLPAPITLFLMSDTR